jgi:hypothetical protein
MRWTDESDEFLTAHTDCLWDKIQKRAGEGVWIRHPVRRPSRVALLIGWLWKFAYDLAEPVVAAVFFVLLMVVLGILIGLIAWGKP